MLCLAASTVNYFVISFNAEALEEESGGGEGVAAPSMAECGSACTKKLQNKNHVNSVISIK